MNSFINHGFRVRVAPTTASNVKVGHITSSLKSHDAGVIGATAVSLQWPSNQSG